MCYSPPPKEIQRHSSLTLLYIIYYFQSFIIYKLNNHLKHIHFSFVNSRYLNTENFFLKSPVASYSKRKALKIFKESQKLEREVSFSVWINFKRKPHENWFSPVERHWIYQPYFRAGLKLITSWPTQNRLQVFYVYMVLFIVKCFLSLECFVLLLLLFGEREKEHEVSVCVALRRIW